MFDKTPLVFVLTVKWSLSVRSANDHEPLDLRGYAARFSQAMRMAYQIVAVVTRAAASVGGPPQTVQERQPADDGGDHPVAARIRGDAVVEPDRLTLRIPQSHGAAAQAAGSTIAAERAGHGRLLAWCQRFDPALGPGLRRVP